MSKRGQSKYMPSMRVKAISGQMGAHRHPGDLAAQHDAMNAKAKTNQVKGKRGGDCNRTQCQRPGAWWYNRTMQAYYCGDCAGAINESCLYKDHIVSFGSTIYVMPPTVSRDDYVEGGHGILITTADGESSLFETAATLDDAGVGFRMACRVADLRTDGSPPFHYSELRDRMLKIRQLIQTTYPDLELVEFV